jgi:hypothetical protein
MKVLWWAGCIGAVLFATTNAYGAVVVGGTLLSPGDANQIETWLGEGPITLTNIYTKVTGQNAGDFHTAVDGQGRTVSVLKVFDGVSSQLIGGYNPQSWASLDAYHITLLDAQRTAFLFNLTGAIIQRQNLISEGAVGSGQYQTYNFFTQGPTFGAGYDLFVDLSLNSGDAHNHSYGGTSGVHNILNGLANDSTFEVGAIEVFSVASGVPEPASVMTCGLLGWAGVGVFYRQCRASLRHKSLCSATGGRGSVSRRKRCGIAGFSRVVVGRCSVVELRCEHRAVDLSARAFHQPRVELAGVQCARSGRGRGPA